jgi:hypothetical protein
MAWLITPRPVAYAVILIINYLLVFTGFGLFMGFISIGLFLIESYRQTRDGWNKRLIGALIALSLAIFSVVLFANGYKFDPAADCFGFSMTYLSRYPFFMGIMFGGLIRVSRSSTVILFGLGLFLLTLIIFVHHLRILLKRDGSPNNKSLVISILLGYSLIYSLSVAIGRACLGVEFAWSSRYVTLMLPATLGIYLHILTINKKYFRLSAIVVLTLMVLLSIVPLGSRDSQVVDFYRSGKQEWKDCYLNLGDIDACNQRTGFSIYPTNNNNLEWKFTYLREHGLNLYHDARDEQE